MTEKARTDENKLKTVLDREKQYEAYIQKAAARFKIRPEDIRAIIGVESQAINGRRAGGTKSASGLMQVTAETWAEMQKKHSDLAKYDFASHWNDAEVNILFGAATLDAKRSSLKSFGIDTNSPEFAKLAVAAYNGGEGVLRLAYAHAKQAGEKKPEEACLHFEHLSVGVKNAKGAIWQYYMPPHKGGTMNKSKTEAEAVELKTKEIMKYPTLVANYLGEEQKEGLTSGPVPAPTPSTKTDAKPREGLGKGDTEPKPTETQVKPGHLIAGSVGEGGDNREADVHAIQDALERHGHSPGTHDGKIGPNTIGAIRAFQAELLAKPDGRIDVGGPSEKHLMGAATKQPTETKEAKQNPAETSAKTSKGAAAQMSRLVSVASSVRGKKPKGMCYHAVKDHIANAGGFGNIHNVHADKRFQPQVYAHNFADVVNRDPAKFGLERISESSPYDAPEGSIVVVKAGSPGTHHPTAGDITVKGPGDEFFNDGHMGYKGRNAWPPKAGGILGVYKPK